MLTIKDLRVDYGGVEAVRGVSFEVPEKSIVTLIGANGAGKGATLRSITGPIRASGGSIRFDNAELLDIDTPDVMAKSITLVPKGRRVFPDMTVIEDIKIGAYLRSDSLEDDINWVCDLFPHLKGRSWQLTGTLSGGEQQILAVARALMSHPKLMMTDEPSFSLAPLIVRDIFNIIEEVDKQGATILLIEQNANMTLRITNRRCVLETRWISLTGAGRELLADELVEAVYLGKKKSNSNMGQ